MQAMFSLVDHISDRRVEVHFKNAQFLYDAIYSYKHTVHTIRSISLFVPKYPIEQWSSYLGRASILL